MSTKVKEQTNQVTEKKSKKPIIIVGAIVIGIVIVTLSVFFIISFNRQNEYNNAVELYNEKQFEQAVNVFSGLNTYKDSQQYLDKCYIGSGDVFLEEKNFENARTEYNKINDSNLKTETLMKCDYSEAEQMFQDQKYKEALSVFEALGEYGDSAAYVEKCKYSEAEQLFKEKKYKEALSAFESLGTYSDSAAYVEKCKIEIKFSKFDFTGEEYQSFYSLYGGDDSIANTDEAEKKISSLYGTWYDENDNKFEITPTLFNGKEYGVCAVGDNTALIYFFEEEDSILRYTKFEDDILGERIACYPSATAMSSTEEYRSVTSAEYDEAYAKWQAEQQAKTPKYSDSEIIELASSKTKETLRTAYSYSGYSAAEMIYHVCEVTSATVSYDWTTRTYTCYLSLSYSTNIFDIFGTSTAYYDVVVTYEDNGAGLVITGFDIY